MGIANTAGTVAGCITPSVTGYFTNGNVSNFNKLFLSLTSIRVLLKADQDLVREDSKLKISWISNRT